MEKLFSSGIVLLKNNINHQIFRIMRLTTFLLAFFTCFAFAENVNSQNARVSLSKHRAELKEVLEEIEKQTDYLFVSNRDIDLEQKVSIRTSNKPVKEVLSTLFEKTNLSYDMEGINIILSVRDNKMVAEQQQTKKLTGTIIDQYGDPVIGANVLVKGTTNGTITDMDGFFTLNNINDNDIVQVTFIGYIPYEVKYAGQTNLQISLKEDAQSLDEIVVVGYGTQKKVNLTGAVSTVSGEDLATRPVANTSSMLQGQIPGLYVMQDGGQPGEEKVSFRIRGYGSYGSSNTPLILINGVEGDLTGLDPNMIQNVSVLKDAASAAIYGSRAANGVILVTTKQGGGGDGKPRIAYHGNISIHTPSKMFDLVTNSAEYMELANLAKKNSGSSEIYAPEEIEKYRNGGGSDQYPNFDWLDYMFNPAIMHTHNLSLGGTTERTTYNMSLNYINQDGTLRGFDYKRYNVTLDLTSRATDWMRVGAYVTLKHGDRNKTRQNQDDAFLSTMSQAPTYKPWLPDDGSGITRWTDRAYTGEDHNKNMAAIVGEGIMKPQKDYDVNTQVWADINILKNLSWYTKGAVRLYSYREEDWRGKATPTYSYHTGEPSGLMLDKGGLGLEAKEYRSFYTNLYSYLKYDFIAPNKDHSFSAQLGYSQETYMSQDLKAYRQDYPFELKTIDAGGQANWSNGGGKQEWALMSFFGRLNYNYKDRYLIEANARYDGSSKLSKSGRWDIFPSFSGAWRLSEETFIKNADISWLSSAKLRASWGQLGNQDINDKNYPYQAMIASVAAYPFDKTSETLSYIQTAYNNEHIKWEISTMTDIGVDLQLFNRLNVTFDWYKKVTSDILRSSQVSGLLGLSAPVVNGGKMQNTGIELSIGWNDMIQDGALKGFAYHANVNFDRSRNKLIDYGAENIDNYYLRREGLPYNQFYMLKCIGVFADQAEIDASPKQFNDRTQPGDLKYWDADGNGKIDNDDRIPMSGYYPGFEYSLNLGASWKGFDLSIFGQGIQDKKFYTNDWGVYPFRQGSAPTKDYLKGMWTEDNPYGAKHPKLYWNDFGGSKNTRNNSYFLRNASYFRIKNLTLGYTLPRSVTDKIGINKLRVYFTGDNLITFTSFDGLDPERTANGRAAQYPQNRSYTFGLNVEF